MKYRVPRQIEVGTENSGPGLRVAIPTTIGPVSKQVSVAAG